MALCLVCGCSRAPSSPKRTEAPYVAIIDAYRIDAYAAIRKGPKPPSGPVTLLRVELKDDDSAFLADLYDLAHRHFADDFWTNYPPDSAYREIVFFSRGRKVVLCSWHPFLEENPGAVASSDGLTSLGEKTPDAVVRDDEKIYNDLRRVFDIIEERLQKQYGG